MDYGLLCARVQCVEGRRHRVRIASAREADVQTPRERPPARARARSPNRSKCPPPLSIARARGYTVLAPPVTRGRSVSLSSDRGPLLLRACRPGLDSDCCFDHVAGVARAGRALGSQTRGPDLQAGVICVPMRRTDAARQPAPPHPTSLHSARLAIHLKFAPCAASHSRLCFLPRPAPPGLSRRAVCPDLPPAD